MIQICFRYGLNIIQIQFKYKANTDINMNCKDKCKKSGQIYSLNWGQEIQNKTKDEGWKLHFLAFQETGFLLGWSVSFRLASAFQEDLQN